MTSNMVSFNVDAIASIPGNENFSHNIDFSGAFHIIAGESWYVVAETLFLISCYAQVSAIFVAFPVFLPSQIRNSTLRFVDITRSQYFALTINFLPPTLESYMTYMSPYSSINFRRVRR